MLLNFQQGIISYARVGAFQTFVSRTGAFVSFSAFNGPTDIAFAHGGSNYLHSESVDVTNAWGPIPVATDTWLFWDLDLQTAARTFGITTLAPQFGPSLPSPTAPIAAGYQVVLLVPPKIGADPTGLIGATTYTATVNIDGADYPISILGSTALTYATLLSQINTDIGIAGVATLPTTGPNAGRIVITSLSTGGLSTVVITAGTLFPALAGFSSLLPSVTGTTPAVDGQHFFDQTAMKMYVFQTGSWREKVRVFAAKVNTLLFTALGSGFPSTPFSGTQVSLFGSSIPTGRIIVDDVGDPIRRQNGEFFTTESDFFINSSPINTIRLEANVQTATALENMAAFHVVQYTQFGAIELAGYNDLQTTAIAILMQDLLVNEVGTLVTQGTVTNIAWNWSTPGAPLWIDDTGELTETDLSVTLPLTHQIAKPPIARVLTPTTIFFDQGLGGKGDKGDTGNAGTPALATNVVAGISKLSIAAVVPANPITVGTNDPRMTDARTPLAHDQLATTIIFTPYGPLTGANVQLAMQQLQDNKVNRSGDTMLGLLTLATNPVNPLHAATKLYVDSLTLNSLTDVTLLAPSLGDALMYDGGVWTNQPLGEPVTQVVYGTGVGIDSSPTFIYNVATGAFGVNPAANATPGDVNINAADGLGLNIDGGDVNISAGTRTGTGVNGIVTLTGGNGDVLQVGASIRMATNGTERLEIETTGAWQIGGVVGPAGQVFTSGGPGVPPTWSPAAGGGSEPNTQMVYGTGGGIDSSSTFTYDVATGALNFAPTAKVTPGDMTIIGAPSLDVIVPPTAGYQEFGWAVPITGATLTGLAPGLYTWTWTIDGGAPQLVTVTDITAATIALLIAEINLQTVGVTAALSFVFPSGTVRLTSDTVGPTSTVGSLGGTLFFAIALPGLGSGVSPGSAAITTNNPGGDVFIDGGDGGSAGQGGILSLNAGDGGTGGNGGNVDLTAGDSAGSNGGSMFIAGGFGNSDGGSVSIEAGDSGGSGVGGDVSVFAGDGFGSDGGPGGGTIEMTAGNGTNGDGGEVFITTGNVIDASTAGDLTITTGSAFVTASGGGNGGDVLINIGQGVNGNVIDDNVGGGTSGGFTVIASSGGSATSNDDGAGFSPYTAFGGNANNIAITSGAGGDASIFNIGGTGDGDSTGGNPGNITLTVGNGGNAYVDGTSTVQQTGANGGNFTVVAGSGGNATAIGGGAEVAGVGGNIQLTAGSGGTSFGGAGDGDGGAITIASGSSSSANGGDITLTTGGGFFGGTVYLVGGDAEIRVGSELFGGDHVSIYTGGNERIRFGSAGAWSLAGGGNPGSSGQSIMSQGSGTPPIWGGATTTIPTASGDPGTYGEWAADASFFYVYTTAGNWRRVLVAAF